MKKTIFSTGIMIILLANVALATTVTTDYAGTGEFTMETKITSPIAPDVTDSVHINTGCGTCCCPGDCCPVIGQYEGHDILTNNPFSASVHRAETDEGCIEINQNYVDNINGQTIYTNYNTYFNGTGYAESYVYAVTGEGMSYQIANGTGTSFVGFTQVVFDNGDFDYGANYGGGVMLCSPGYAGLSNQYEYNAGEINYVSELGMYCQPASSESSLYAYLFSEATDRFGLLSQTELDNANYYQDIGVGEGASSYGNVIETEDGDIYFGFDMILG